MAGKNSRGHLIFMAVTASIGGILFGYDTAVISGTTEIVRYQFELGDIQEGWYVGCALIGSILGVLASGMLSDGLGRKMTMLISAVLFSVSAIGCAVCPDFGSLVAYRIVGGVGIGIVSVVSPIYISEVSPAKVRGTLVSLYQLAITAGFLLAPLPTQMPPIAFHMNMAQAWHTGCSTPSRGAACSEVRRYRPSYSLSQSCSYRKAPNGL